MDTHDSGAAARGLVDGSVDQLVREEPLLLVVGGTRLLTMRTPGDEVAWAVGFLASEGLIEGRDDVRSVEHTRAPDSDHVELVLHRAAHARLDARLSRTHEVRPSCGVCGLDGVDTLLDGMRPLPAGRPRLTHSALLAMVADLCARQPLFQATGACHGAALFAADGTLLACGEDVGRHNALDKAIGKVILAGGDLSEAVAVLSGRAGYELVIKLLRVGCPVTVSVSAPSALAFDLCREAGATLVGFARGERLKVYWDAGRLSDGPQRS